MRKDDFNYLLSELNKTTQTRKIPTYYEYCLDKRNKNLTIKLLARGLKSNMQDDESAFESWAIVFKYYLRDLINTVTIDWEDLPPENKEGSLHFNRFIYRLGKFVQTYDWVKVSKTTPSIPTILACNCPNGEAAKQEAYPYNSEGWIECMFVEREKAKFDHINHQLPVGLFENVVSKKTYFATGQHSCIDIWAIKGKQMYVFELKKPDNNPLGIISELMFYTNVVNDILSHRIIYKYNNNKTLNEAISNNYRGFRDFYSTYKYGNIERINAVLLADTFHPLITQELLDFINESVRLKYLQIKYSKQTVGL